MARMDGEEVGKVWPTERLGASHDARLLVPRKLAPRAVVAFDPDSGTIFAQFQTYVLGDRLGIWDFLDARHVEWETLCWVEGTI